MGVRVLDSTIGGLLLTLMLWLSAHPSLVFAQWEEQAFSSMGTNMHVSIWHSDAKVRASAILAVKAEMDRLDDLLSFYKPQSALMKMNEQAAKSPVKVPAELFNILMTAQQISTLSRGAFDVTVGTFGALYDLRKERAPSGNDLDHLRPAVSYRHVVLDGAHGTVAFKHPDIQVDLGGIAKGYAVDQCIALLSQYGITQAEVTAGGDTRFLGRRGDRPWWVGIRHPRVASESALVLPLESRSISTSGDYERFFIKEGRRIHHIIDPATGWPSQGLASVSILAEHSVWADGLSTAVFVLGGPAGLALINQMPDVDAIMIDLEGKVFYSDGFEALNADHPNIEVAMPQMTALP